MDSDVVGALYSATTRATKAIPRQRNFRVKHTIDVDVHSVGHNIQRFVCKVVADSTCTSVSGTLQQLFGLVSRCCTRLNKSRLSFLSWSNPTAVTKPNEASLSVLFNFPREDSWCAVPAAGCWFLLPPPRSPQCVCG